MPSPTFVASYPCASFSTATSPKTASVTVANGDVLAIVVVADGPGRTITPSGGGLTYNQRAIINTTNEGYVAVFIAESNSAQSFTLSISDTGGTEWGFEAIRWSNARDALNGASTSLSGGPSANAYVTLATANANSSVACGVSDFNAPAFGASTAWLEDNATAGTQLDYAQSSPNYTYGIGYFTNAGTAASHTFGMQNNSQGWSTGTGIAAAEIKYQAAGGSAVTENMTAGGLSWSGTNTQALAGVTELGKPAATSWAGTTLTTSLTSPVSETLKPAGVSWTGTMGTTAIGVVVTTGPAAVSWSGAAPGLDIIDQVNGTGPPAVAWAGTNLTTSTITPTIVTATAGAFSWAGTVMATALGSAPTIVTTSPAALSWTGGNGAIVSVTVTNNNYLYTPPTWRNPSQMGGALVMHVRTSTCVYRMGGVWHNQLNADMDNPVVANVDVDPSGLLLLFVTPTVVPSSLHDELSAITPADPSWSPGTLTLLP